MLVCVFLHMHLARETAGAARTRSSLRPLFLGRNEFAKLGRSVSRGREGVFSCHHPRRRMIQYSEEPVIEPRTRGVLDTPPSRSMTVEGGASSSTSMRGALATKQSSSCFAGARNDEATPGHAAKNKKGAPSGAPFDLVVAYSRGNPRGRITASSTFRIRPDAGSFRSARLRSSSVRYSCR
jgi:hypothetical protein